MNSFQTVLRIKNRISQNTGYEFRYLDRFGFNFLCECKYNPKSFRGIEHTLLLSYNRILGKKR